MKKHSYQDKQDKKRSKRNGLVLLDFFSLWSSPCHTQSSILDELSETSEGIVNIVKVNIDDPGSNPEEYGISALPTLCLLKDGVEVKRFIGVQPLDTLLEEIKFHIS